MTGPGSIGIVTCILYEAELYVAASYSPNYSHDISLRLIVVRESAPDPTE